MLGLNDMGDLFRWGRRWPRGKAKSKEKAPSIVLFENRWSCEEEKEVICR